MIKKTRITHLASLFACSSLCLASLDTLFSRPSFATLRVSIHPAPAGQSLFVDTNNDGKVDFSVNQTHLPSPYKLSGTVIYKHFNGGANASLTLTNVILDNFSNQASDSVPFQFDISFDTGIFPAETGPFQMTTSLAGSVKTVGNVPFTNQLKLIGSGFVGPSSTKVAEADATFGSLLLTQVPSPHVFNAVKTGTFNSPITSFFGNFLAVFRQPFEKLDLPNSLSIELSKAATSLGSYTFDIDPVAGTTEFGGTLFVDLLNDGTAPSNLITGFGTDSYFISNLDAAGTPGTVKDPITLLPIGTRFGTGPLAPPTPPTGLTDNLWLSPQNPTAVHLTAGGFAFQYDPINIEEAYQVFYKDVTNPPAGVASGPQYLGCWQGNNCTTTRISISVPGPLPLLGVGAAFGYSRRLRKRIKTSKTPEVISAIG